MGLGDTMAKTKNGISLYCNKEQTERLLQFKAEHGRCWRRKLIDLWAAGKDDHDPLLRQIRNKLGPSGVYQLPNGLWSVALPDEKNNGVW